MAKPSRAKLQRLIDLSPVVHYVAKASEDYDATYVSAGIKAQLGYEATQFTQDSEFWTNHIHPDDRPRILADLKQLFEKGWHAHEYRFLHADGSYRWMHDSLSLVRDAGGSPIEIIGSWFDITMRKDAEEALIRTHDQFETRVKERTAALLLSELRSKDAQRIAKIGDWEWDIANGRHWWSDELYRMFGLDPEQYEPSYESYIERIHPDDRGSLVNPGIRDFSNGLSVEAPNADSNGAIGQVAR